MLRPRSSRTRAAQAALSAARSTGTGRGARPVPAHERLGDECREARVRLRRREPGSLVYLETAGKVLLIGALVLAVVGLAALGLAKLGIDRVPGTLSWKSDNVTVFVPVGLMLLVSIVGTIVLNVFLRP